MQCDSRFHLSFSFSFRNILALVSIIFSFQFFVIVNESVSFSLRNTEKDSFCSPGDPQCRLTYFGHVTRKNHNIHNPHALHTW